MLAVHLDQSYDNRWIPEMNSDKGTDRRSMQR